MALLLPVAVAALLYLAFRSRGDSSRTALLRAVVLSVTTLVTISEVLSFPHLLTQPSLAIAWAIVLSGISFFLFRIRRSRPSVPAIESRPAIHMPPHLASVDIVLAAIVCAVLTSIGYKQTLLLNATELVAFNTCLLYGSDRFPYLVAFFSLVGSVIAATLIASRFGAHRTGQLLSALFVLTIPELVLESFSPTTRGVGAFFIVTTCCFLLKAGAEPNLWDFTTAALATGLALLTDGLTVVYLPILLIGCIAFRPPSVRAWMFKRLPLFIAPVLAINVSSFIRSYGITGTSIDAPIPSRHTLAHPTLFATHAGEFIHLALILTCFAILIFLRLNEKDRRVRSYVLSIIIASIACSAVARGQLWSGRFHIPLFIMAAVLVGCTAERLLPRLWQVLAFAALLLSVAAPYLLPNFTSSILSIKGFSWHL